jgi:hypothetical protein
MNRAELTFTRAYGFLIGEVIIFILFWLVDERHMVTLIDSRGEVQHCD